MDGRSRHAPQQPAAGDRFPRRRLARWDDSQSRWYPPWPSGFAERKNVTIEYLMTGGDPVNSLVASLNRPGGNVTGAIWSTELMPKRLGMLGELVPRAIVISFLVSTANGFHPSRKWPNAASG